MTNISGNNALRFLSFALWAIPCVLFSQLPDTAWHPTAFPHDRMTRLPAEPRTGPVEVFFPGEPGPKEPYIQVALLNESGLLGTNASERVNALREKARQLGCDAVMVMGVQSFGQQEVVGDYINVSANQTVTAMGILYQRNIIDLQNIIKSLWIRRWETYESDGSLKTVRKELFWKGTVLMEAGIFPENYRKLTEQTAPASVVYGQEGNWKTTIGDNSKIKYKVYNHHDHTYTFFYRKDSANLISSISVAPYGLTFVPLLFLPPLIPAYDAQGRVNAMTFTALGGGKMRTEVTYATELNWSRSDTWVLTATGERHYKAFSVSYERPTKADVEQLMAEEVVKQP